MKCNLKTMDKIVKLIWIIGLLFAACTDDNEDGMVIPPEIPENDLNISVPADSVGWVPGMAYQPYPGMPETSLGEKVYVVVLDAEDHGKNIMHVLKNEAWPWWLNDTDKANLEQCCFPPHEDIVLDITESYDTKDLEGRECDMVNYSVSQHWLDLAKANMDNYEEIFGNDFPLIVTSAGNGTNTFTQEAWDICLETGNLVWEELIEYFGWNPDGPFTPEQQAWFKPGDVFAAYFVQDPDNRGHAKDIIVVGRDDGLGNKPGPILKERWICTYYSFGIDDVRTDGTSFSTPYVLKIAAEIKRRAPHYTNDDIAQLIFSTADDLGSPGCDEVYGWGRMNPAAIWKELSRRGY